MSRLIHTILFLIVAAGLCAQVEFDIRAFADSTKYGWQDWRDRSAYREDLLDRQKLLQIYEIESSSIRDNIIRSAFIPGLGQISSKAGTKGSIILGAELLSLGTAVYFYDRSNFYYRKYLEATSIEDIEFYYTAAQNPRQYSMFFIGLGVVIWAYNLYDVIQTTDDYNARVWQDILNKYQIKRVSLAPNGVQVNF